MALQGPFLVVADNPARDVADALRAAGAFPIVEADWNDAAAAVGSVAPQGVVLAGRHADSDAGKEQARLLGDQLDADGGPLIPIVARLSDDAAPPIADALVISASVPVAHIARRLAAALRVRALHGTVLRRASTLAARGDHLPEFPISDPLEDATVLVAGRGRSYPALAVAIGERVGLVGALSVESAARALNARDIDGMVIGDGFSPRIIEALLTVLAADARFRDLPVAMLGGQPGVAEAFYTQLPNLERLAAGPGPLVERFLPYVRVHAFGERLKRMLKSLDAKGMIDPDTGLLGHEVFWRDLNRAVDDAERRGVGLSIARFSFERGDRRTSLDAARLLSRLMRQVDFACRDTDDSIFAVFTETDLRAAHVIARRIASVIKHTMLEPDRKRSGVETAVTLATLKPSDDVRSLLARVVAG
jgi:GGDEF domain-containing protein